VASYIQKLAEQGEGRWRYDLLQIYMRDVELHRSFTAKDAQSIFQEIEKCPERRSELIEQVIHGNLKLVVKLAFKHLWRGTRAGLTVMDLIQEGAFGLMRATETYDWRVATFSTYAARGIDWSIKRAVTDYSQGHGTRVPNHVHDVMNRVYKVRTTLEKTLERAPKPREIYTEFKRIEKKEGQKAPTLKELGRAISVAERGALTLGDGSDGDDGVIDFTNFLPSQTLPPDTLIHAKEQLSPLRVVIAAVEHEIEQMPVRTATVLTLRLGLGGRHEQTLEQVAQRYELTRERIRQIEVQGLKRLEERLGFNRDDITRVLAIQDELLRLIESAT